MPPLVKKSVENGTVSSKTVPTPSDSTVDKLRPYTFHGVQLTQRGSHGVGTCPFCGRDGKFSVSVDSGLWRCFVCGSGTDAGGGNAHTFLRLLWERSDAATNGASNQLAQERGLMDPITLTAWGVCQSIVDHVWMVPGYDIAGKMTQLYRRVKMVEHGKWVQKLLPTPGVWPEGKVHALHMASLTFDITKPRIDLFEGPWDGMAYWEIARQTKHVDKHLLEVTGSETSSLVADSNVIAVPGCWGLLDHWMSLFKGKDVTLWYDSDHPRVINGKTFRAGFDGMYRVSKKLSGIARTVRWLRWGKEGYDPEKPSGYDVRDHLRSKGLTATNRRDALAELLPKIEAVPADWFNVNGTELNGKHMRPYNIDARQCKAWKDLEPTWMEALEWRKCIGDVLAVLLSIASSTKQSGNQLFFQVIGPPGSAKTTLCEGLLISDHCHHLEHLTSFYSGWKKPGEGDKDCSLLARINGKTLITPEADVLMSSPKFLELMGQQRRIFDGKAGKTYANTDEDRLYEGLRTPWIMAGTQKLMGIDQSGLGDRFLRIYMDEPTDDVKRNILRRSLRTERAAILESSNGTADSITDPKLRLAYSMTGGYVDWLRANVETLLPEIDMSVEMEDKIINLAELTADLRARPDMDPKKHETFDIKELPTRLTRQFGRLALCLAVVLNKRCVDDEVMRMVQKVAFDTSYSHSMNIVKWMCARNRISGQSNQSTGLMLETLRTWAGMTEERMSHYLNFLRKIKVVDHIPGKHSRGTWKLTERVYDLYIKIGE